LDIEFLRIAHFDFGSNAEFDAMNENSCFVIRLGKIGILLFSLFLFSLGSGCQKSLTTDTPSSQFSSSAQKIAFLSRYAKLPSTPTDVEYQIHYQDNSGGMVPGPSDSDIKLVALVKAEDIPLWTNGFKEVPSSETDFAWTDEILPKESRWAAKGEAKYYRKSTGNGELAVFSESGLVFYRIEKH
jgi:hypothetical protein